MLFAAPLPSESWIDYDVGLRVEVDQGVAVGTTLPTVPLKDRGRSSGAMDAYDRSMPTRHDSTMFPPATDVLPGKSGTGGETFVHQRVKPTVYIILFGSAIRAGYPIPVPELVEINGEPVTPANRADGNEFFEQKVIGNVFYPVYAARWRLRYVLPVTPPGPLPIPPNPVRS